MQAVVEFMYLVFTCMPGELPQAIQLLLLNLSEVFQVLINSHLC